MEPEVSGNFEVLENIKKSAFDTLPYCSALGFPTKNIAQHLSLGVEVLLLVYKPASWFNVKKCLFGSLNCTYIYRSDSLYSYEL